jgi:hypothetical protein
MSVKENVHAVHRAIAQFNAKDLEGYLDMFDRSVVFHGLSRKLKPATQLCLTDFRTCAF